MRISRLLLLFFICIYALHAGAQLTNNTFKVPEIIPRSPEAANLGRYGDISVGEYTGAAAVSVPLHVVKGGKLQFPINLYYNPTGIKVNQEATWVGLGWELSAVAGITYAPVGGNDQAYTLYTPWSDWQHFIDYVNPLKIGPATRQEDRPIWCDHFTSQMDYPNVLGAAQAQGAKDLFSVNCMDLSFKFYIDPVTNKGKVFGNKLGYKIEFLNGGINVGFKITDNNGIMYYFNQVEKSQAISTNSVEIANAWYVTEIRRPDGDWIKFRYSNFGIIKPVPALSEQFMASGAVEFEFRPRTVQASNNWVQNQYLTEIESATELVQFTLGSGRLDINGGGARKLDAITVTDKFTGRKKGYSFQYDYFVGEEKGGNYLYDDSRNLQDDFTNDNLKNRLKLLSVTEKDQSSNENKKYTFTYDETKALPYKTSFSVDHWGFYNGQENSSTLLNNYYGARHTNIPQIFSTLLFDPYSKPKLSGVDQYIGAYRGCSKDFVKTASLKSITYPTGGRTEFTLEPNSFTNYSILSAEEESQIRENIETITSWDFNNEVGSHAESFTLLTETVVTLIGNINNRSNGTGELFDCNQMMNASITLFCGTGGFTTTTWRPTCLDYQGNVLNKTWNLQLTLPAGTYALITTLPDNLGFQGYTPLVVATIKYRSRLAEEAIVANHIESIGEGLRIKKIENYTGGNTLVSSREFKYMNADGTSSGKLLMPLKYAAVNSFVRNTNTPGSGSCNMVTMPSVVFSSGNMVSVLSAPMKANLGYDRVEIIDKDINGLESNGKIIKTFKNDGVSNLFFDDIKMTDLPMAGLLNGYPSSITYQRQDGNIIREELFSYENWLYEKDWINLKIRDLYQPSVGCECVAPGGAEPRRYVLGSYWYARYKNFLTKKVEIDHTPTGNVRTETGYEYNLNNYEISKIKTTNSKGELMVETIKYPHDFTASSSLYDIMVTNNMISAPIETIKYKGETEQLERVKTNYSMVDNFYIEPVSVERQLKASAPATLIYYNRYSDGGNITEYKAANGITMATIWGYNSTLPVAYVENASIVNIFYTGFEDGDGNSADYDSRTGLKSHTGAYSKQLTDLTNGDYIFSYWLRSATNWVFSSQKVTVTSGSYTISFTDGQQVDDVRFHPAGSNMKTFTYEPISGVTSATDINNMTTYYDYDEYGRLSMIRDNYKNILKRFCYNYQGQPESCLPGVGNVQKSGTFTRNNCASGAAGGTVTYTIAANTYFAATQQDADALAQNDVDTKGQAYANENGTCPTGFYNAIKSGTFTRNNCPSGTVPGTFTYTVAAGKYYSSISQAAADQMAQDDLNANGQTLANNTASCTWYNVAKSGTFTRNNCPSGTGSAVTYTVDAGKYSSTVSQADADQLAQNDVNTKGQAYANDNGTCPITCSVSLNSGYFNVANSVTSNGTTVTLAMAFFSYSTISTGNVPYAIGAINGSCKPSVSRTLSFSSNGRLWTLTIDTTGKMTLYMANGSNLSPQTVVSTGTLTFNL